MKKLRACPICPDCGSKKFEKIKSEETTVKCIRCGKELTI